MLALLGREMDTAVLYQRVLYVRSFSYYTSYVRAHDFLLEFYDEKIRSNGKVLWSRIGLNESAIINN